MQTFTLKMYLFYKLKQLVLPNHWHLASALVGNMGSFTSVHSWHALRHGQPLLWFIGGGAVSFTNISISFFLGGLWWFVVFVLGPFNTAVHWAETSDTIAKYIVLIVIYCVDPNPMHIFLQFVLENKFMPIIYQNFILCYTGDYPNCSSRLGSIINNIMGTFSKGRSLTSFSCGW